MFFSVLPEFLSQSLPGLTSFLLLGFLLLSVEAHLPTVYLLDSALQVVWHLDCQPPALSAAVLWLEVTV